jgi:hypothetical protein
MLDKSLSGDCGHILIGMMNPLPAMEAQREGNRSNGPGTTAREFSTYAAGFGERPFLPAPAFPRV